MAITVSQNYLFFYFSNMVCYLKWQKTHFNRRILSFQGPSCRTRVTKHLSKEFGSLTEAEEALNIDYVLSSSLLDGRESTTPNSTTGRHLKTFIHPTSNLSPIFSCSPNAKLMETTPGNKVGDTINDFLSCFKSNMMSTRLKTQLTRHLLELFIGQTKGPNVAECVESDFITTIVKGTRSLFDRKKENLIYQLSKCFEGSVDRR